MGEVRLPKVWLVADDYGLSPGVDRGIRELISSGRLSGTGCMTLFPEWTDSARQIKTCAGVEKAVIGLHMTLTDFAPMTGDSALAESGRLPPLKNLIARSFTQKALEAAIFSELDRQLDAFVTEMGHMPHYLDGHQHAHFLPPVRAWLKARFSHISAGGIVPWIRGAPSLNLSAGLGMKAKVAFVRGLARGFDVEMKKTGYRVAGPLAGFYDWSKPADFEGTLRDLSLRVSDGSVVMCHPGYVDDALRNRDNLIEARAVELEALAHQTFFRLNERFDAEGQGC